MTPGAASNSIAGALESFTRSWKESQGDYYEGWPAGTLFIEGSGSRDTEPRFALPRGSADERRSAQMNMGGDSAFMCTRRYRCRRSKLESGNFVKVIPGSGRPCSHHSSR